MIFELVLRAVIVAVALLSAFAGLMLMERKLLGFFQYRLGPNRVGPWGLMQPLADGVKMIFKEDIVPKGADRLLFYLAPIVSVFVAITAFAVIPLAPAGEPGGQPLGVADPNAGVLVLLAIASLGVYGLALGGWASQSKYALLGSLRATAQMISYELAMALALLAVIALAGSVRLSDIVAAQAGLWNILAQPAGFLVFFIASIAETNRTPFDLPEAETELVSGYNTEYSGIRFAMFYMAEYVNMLTSASLTTALYLGGWLGPSVLPPLVWFLAKVAAVLFVFIWLRATMPRLRYDQLMSFGWKRLVPLGVLNLIGVAVYVAVTSA